MIFRANKTFPISIVTIILVSACYTRNEQTLSASGTVTDETRAKALADATVRVFSAECADTESLETCGNIMATATSDANGQFTLEYRYDANHQRPKQIGFSSIAKGQKFTEVRMAFENKKAYTVSLALAEAKSQIATSIANPVSGTSHIDLKWTDKNVWWYDSILITRGGTASSTPTTGISYLAGDMMGDRTVMHAGKLSDLQPTASGDSFQFQWRDATSLSSTTYSYSLWVYDQSKIYSTPTDLSAATIDTTPPAALTNVTCNNGTGPGTIELKWTRPADATMVYILRNVDSEITNTLTTDTVANSPNIHRSSANTTGTVDSDTITSGHLYRYRLYAADAANNLSPYVDCGPVTAL